MPAKPILLVASLPFDVSLMATMATEKHAAIDAWSIRQARNTPMCGASAQPMEEAVKTATETRTTGRRP